MLKLAEAGRFWQIPKHDCRGFSQRRPEMLAGEEFGGKLLLGGGMRDDIHRGQQRESGTRPPEHMQQLYMQGKLLCVKIFGAASKRREFFQVPR